MTVRSQQAATPGGSRAGTSDPGAPAGRHFGTAHRRRSGAGAATAAVATTRWSTPYVLAAVVVFGAGVAERVLLYVRSMPTNSDEALSVLMARDIWHGHLPLFLWGQSFGGVPEVYPLAVLVKAFPGSLLADRLLTIVFSAAAAAVGGWIASRLAGAAAGLVAGAVLWLWPVFFVNWSMHEYLYYVPVVLLGLAGMAWSMKTWTRPRSVWLPLLVGVAGGLSFWMNPQMVTFVPPIAVALLRLGQARWRRAVVAGVGALIGVLPWLAFNLRHHFVSLNPGALDQHASYLSRIHELLRDGGAVGLGLETEGGTWIGSWAHPLYAAAVIVGMLVAFGAVVSWRRLGGPPPIDVVGVICYPFLYALSPAAPGYGTVSVRYFFFMWPWVALLAGRAMPTTWALLPAARSRRPAEASPAPRRTVTAAVGAAAIVTSLALAAVSVDVVRRAPRAAAPPGMTAAGYNFRLASFSLEAHGTTEVLTDYWLAYMLDKASNGRVIATPSDPLDVRYGPWDAEVHRSPRPAWLFVSSSVKYHSFSAWLATTHRGAMSFSAAGFVVVVPSGRVVPSDVPVTAYRDPGENY